MGEHIIVRDDQLTSVQQAHNTVFNFLDECVVELYHENNNKSAPSINRMVDKHT